MSPKALTGARWPCLLAGCTVMVVAGCGTGSAPSPPVDAVGDRLAGDLVHGDLPPTDPGPILVVYPVDRPSTLRDEPWRPQVHFTPESGWMNDPNGLVHLDGEWHLFFQHYPHLPFWGPMHWGHAVGSDLIHWTPLPIALYPDDDLGWAFSGSAAVARGGAANACGTPDAAARCLVAVFTHHGGLDGTEKQSLAVSADRGRTWSLVPGNPVLGNPDLADFRDPKIWYSTDHDAWFLVLAAGDRALLFRSDNLLDWVPTGSFGPVEGLVGVWECPDLFPLPVDGDPNDVRCVFKIDMNRGFTDGSPGSFWFSGDFDGTAFVADDIGPRPLDGGPDFYAAQSWSDVPDGPRHLAVRRGRGGRHVPGRDGPGDDLAGDPEGAWRVALVIDENEM